MKMIRTLGCAFGAALVLAGSPALAEGEKVFRKCKACHTVEEGKHKAGPSLFGIVGRLAGSLDDYKYSQINQAAAQAGLVWTEDAIVDYLANPQKYLKAYLESMGKDAPGKTRMNFTLRKKAQRADVVAYLKSLN